MRLTAAIIERLLWLRAAKAAVRTIIGNTPLDSSIFLSVAQSLDLAKPFTCISTTVVVIVTILVAVLIVDV